CVTHGSEMAAVQDAPVEADNEKEIKTETLNDAAGNHASAAGGVIPSPPVASTSSSGPAKAGGPGSEEQQTLMAVLQFLKKNNFVGAVDVLRREAGILEDSDESQGQELAASALGGAEAGDATCTLSRASSCTTSTPAVAAAPAKGGEDQPDVNVVLSAYSQQGDPALYQGYYSGLKKFVESVLDCHRAELSQLFYPLFVHMYLELVYNNHETEAKAFFENKFVLRISRDSYQLLKRHLQERQNNQIWNIIQEHLYIDIFDGMPRSKSQIDKPEIDVPLDDEDEEGENEEGKPKKKKPKKDSMGSKSKKQDPNAPQQNRIPLPELKDSDKLDKIMYMKEATKRIRLGPESLPSICFYTFLNAYQGLTAVDFTDDSSLIAGGFADSTVRVWSVTPKKLRSVKSAADLNLIDKESDDVLERIMDEKSASESKILYGHSGPVYGVSFSPDRNYLLSCSEDGTVRLWSLQTFTCLVGYKGHNYPVWDTQFSPYGYYFISGGHDRVARLWATDHYQPLRMFAGHLADITCTQFHPNSNYVATGSADRTVRLWDILNGNCVRIFTGHKGPIHSLAFSPNGKYLASGATDGRVLLWDIGHGLMIGELKGHTDTVYSLKFSRDGEILASGSMDNTVRLWDSIKAFDDIETDDFTAATGHIHLPENSQELLLGTYMTKSTPVIHLHFTRRNLLLAAGAYNP
ncbi:transcription initiation factor TFIID subunit 5-like, partial [Scleropages formosus]